MEDPVSLRNTLANEDWDSISNILTNLDTGINGSRDTRVLKKKVGMIRQILLGQLGKMNGSNEINLSFLVGNIKTVEKLETEFDMYGVKEKEFVIFLRLLLYKFEKLKLIADKPMERRIELFKLKGAVENAEDI